MINVFSSCSILLTWRAAIKNLKIIIYSKNMQIGEETEGAIALRKLQSSELKFLSREELEIIFLKAGLSQKRIAKEEGIINYISKCNNLKIVPSNDEIRRAFSLDSSQKAVYMLRNLGLAFNFTMPEMASYYGLEYLGFNYGFFNPPEHLEWSTKYLSELISGARGCKISWCKRISPESVRSPNYNRYWTSILKDENGLPYCLPLGLHIPKQQKIAIKAYR